LENIGQQISEQIGEQISNNVGGIGPIAGVALVAVMLGLLFIQLRQPPIVGYILAGILLGPTGFGLIEQSQSIELLAELGVLLLLFLIGMEISVRAFVLVLAPAVLIAGGQLFAGAGIAAAFGWLLGWSVAQTVLIGFIIAISSTAVAIKMLDEIGELRTETGRIAIGVLVAQDIAVVPMLIVAEGFGGERGLTWLTFGLIASSIVLLGAMIWYLNEPGKIHLPFTRQITGKRDMIALGMLAMCFSAATVSAVLGLSPVYGAFVAGLIVSNSTLRAEAVQLTFPVQSILVFVFFLSIGLLIDLDYILANWVTVLGFVMATVAAKTALNIFLVRRVGFGWAVAFPAGLAMAQIGEFSFILAATGFRNGALDHDSYRLALSVIALTLVISPVWMVSVRRFHDATARGLTDFRTALAETYAPEIEELLRGKSAASRAAYRGRVYVRAVRLARHRRRNETATAREQFVTVTASVEEAAITRPEATATSDAPAKETHPPA
jgi:CPA2 family monovalent cation:H+ antiporter-2